MKTAPLYKAFFALLFIPSLVLANNNNLNGKHTKEKKVHKEFNVNSITKMASSYKFCVIAAGEYDIYAAKERANEWDYAAGHAIAQNAGAIIKTLDEKPFLYGKEDYRNPSLLIKRSENLND